jgi:hypothetical protein
MPGPRGESPLGFARASFARASSARALFAAAVLCFGFLSSCSQGGCERAFYYWKAAPPSERELGLLRELSVGKLYLRAFDIDEEGAAVGASRLGAGEIAELSRGLVLVPVVYIVNGYFAGASPGSGTLPAAGVLAKDLAARLESGGWLAGGRAELQVDCDWTPSTRDAYFSFLKALRDALHGATREAAHDALREEAELNVPRLSVTIRLHQAKDRATNGIPPVERGMLMAYNLLNPADAGGRSAILDLETLKAYLPSLGDYPLPLDLALPAWSWVSQFEGSRFIGLIPDPGAPGELRVGPYEDLGGGRYRARERGLLAGRTVEAGDLFFIDESRVEKTLEAAKLLAGSFPREGRSLALYHLDWEGLRAFSGGSPGSMSKIYSAFGE